jgi:hypothetical protein
VSGGRTPARLRQPPALQRAAGQFGEGVGAPLGGARLLRSAGAGEWFQGGAQGLAGLGVQQPVHGDHAVDGGGHPQAALLVLALRAGVGGVGVGDLTQVPDDLA